MRVPRGAPDHPKWIQSKSNSRQMNIDLAWRHLIGRRRSDNQRKLEH